MSDPQALAEQFDDLGQQRHAAELGMWIFLATEALFFGGLLLGYAVYRHLYPEAWFAAARETEILIGTANTAILLTSSLTMWLAVRAGEEGRRDAVTLALGLTATLGAFFLGLKAYEYYLDWDNSLVPGLRFAFEKADPEHAEIFYYLYFFLTGVHAVHLTVAITAVLVVLFLVRTGRLAYQQSATLTVLGLYWHLVDVVWIFLYPLIYLPGRSQ
ncbi:MAG: cytochrome c oxidase subunit 3 [Geminicoccaceae bacterium]|nr:cytochrome c oxidase subunit 3 [Geminicoccaceae bacterium]